MSGPAAGLKQVPVVCGTCNGSGRTKSLNHRFVFVDEICPICLGSGSIKVPRKRRLRAKG